MSKKFLSESQIRRFQGLAGIPAVNEMGGGYYGDRDEEELPGDEVPGEGLPPDMGDEVGGRRRSRSCRHGSCRHGSFRRRG